MCSGFLGWNMCVLALRASGGSSLILSGLCRTISMNWNSYARPLLIPMLIRTLSPLFLLTCSPFPDHVPKAQSKRQLPVHQHFIDYRDKDSVIGTASNSAEVRDCQTPHPLSKHPRGLAVGAGWGHCASHRAKAARKDASCPILALKKPFLILIIKTEGTDSSYQSKVTNRKERGLHQEASGPSKGWLKDEKARTLSWGQRYSCSHGNSGHYPGYVGPLPEMQSNTETPLGITVLWLSGLLPYQLTLSKIPQMRTCMVFPALLPWAQLSAWLRGSVTLWTNDSGMNSLN